MSLKNYLSESHILIFLKLIPDMICEYWRFSGNNARCNMSKDPDKLLTEILMTTHALEKGLSIYNRKKGFGLTKMNTLLKNIEKYISKYGYSENLAISISVLKVLSSCHHNDGIKDERLSYVINGLNDLTKSLNLQLADFRYGGTIKCSEQKMLELKSVNFVDLCKGRHSFRHFGKDSVSVEKIEEALELARNTPSACNRQAYRVHIFNGEQKDSILQTQGGANSFYKEADKAILITGNLKRYYTMEQHLAYVDASLFAMTLIYSLTAKGIASIPLTMGRRRSTIDKIYKNFNIPTYEVPVILIAIGVYPEEAEVSLSHRNSVESFTTFH